MPQGTPGSRAGFIPNTPGTKLRYRRRVILAFCGFLLISLGVHWILGPTFTGLAPLWRTPDVQEQGFSIITLSRAKLAFARPTPTPTPPPLKVNRTIAKLSPLKYLEMGGGGLRHSIRPPARRTSMLAIRTAAEPSPSAAPDTPAVTNVMPLPGPTKAPVDTAQADTGANQARLAGSIQWGDDNPPRLIALAAPAVSADGTRQARIEVEVGPDGQVLSVRLVGSSGDPAIDAAALDAIRKSSFAPATLNGLPVHGKCIIEFPSGSLVST